MTSKSIAKTLVLTLAVLCLTSCAEPHLEDSKTCWGEFEDVHAQFTIHYNNGFSASNKTEARRHYEAGLQVVAMFQPSSYGNVHPDFTIVITEWKIAAQDLLEYRIQKLENWVGGNAEDEKTDRLREAQQDAAEAVPAKFLELYPL